MDIKTVQLWLSGEKLRSKFLRKQYKLIALVVAMIFVYILAGYNSMRQQRHLSDLKREVKMAKFEYLTISAQLAEQTRQSKIGDRISEWKVKVESGKNLEENRMPIIMIEKSR